MKKVLLLIALIAAIYGGALFVMIGLPMFLIRNNQTLELVKEQTSQPHRLEFKVNSTISGDDITFDINQDLSCAISVTLNIQLSAWEMKITKPCTLTNGYCRLKLPPSVVTDEAIFTSLELQLAEERKPVEKLRLFIGNIL